MNPWMKFFPSDWRADPVLRMCSIGARGLWMEMLCLMHEAHPRGHLLVNGNDVTVQQLSSLCGTAPAETKRLMAELEAAGVFSRAGETIISRRMCRDTARAEQDKANGGKGGNPGLKRGVNPYDKGGDKAQKLEPIIQNLVFIGVSDVRWPACAARQEAETGKPAFALSSQKQMEPGRYFPAEWPEAQRKSAEAAA